MVADPTQVRLGKQAPRDDPRTLRLARYLTPEAPSIPDHVDWASKVAAWPMMANDTVGDCTIAAQGHCVEQWTQYSVGAPVILSDDDILAAYSAVSGYDPTQVQPDGSNPTDVGATCLDALNHWRKTGVGGHHADAFVQVDHANHDEVRRAVQLFGNAYLGVQLPITAQGQAVWDVVGDPAKDPAATPGSWGGHCVPVVGYGSDGLTVVTWGELVSMTWAFLDAYVDEVWAVVAGDWLNSRGVDPVGLDMVQLQADLANIAAPPDLPSDPTPVPDPTPIPDPGPDPTVVAEDLAVVEADREVLDADLDQLEADEVAPPPGAPVVQP